MAVRKARTAKGVTPSMKRVDTCAAEFQADTPYLYSSYDGNDEAESTNEPKILILGGGPNRIGQGIEFDYCCCHAAFALSGAGYETIMLNSNPETVSTDYDTSDRLYFEPLTVEDVLNVCETERPEGIIVQFGGQTPLSLATRLEAALKANPIPAASGNGFTKILGTPPDSIDAAEDRERWIDIFGRTSNFCSLRVASLALRTRRWLSPKSSVTPSWFAPRTSSVVVRWKLSDPTRI